MAINFKHFFIAKFCADKNAGAYISRWYCGRLDCIACTQNVHSICTSKYLFVCWRAWACCRRACSCVHAWSPIHVWLWYLSLSLFLCVCFYRTKRIHNFHARSYYHQLETNFLIIYNSLEKWFKALTHIRSVNKVTHVIRCIHFLPIYIVRARTFERQRHRMQVSSSVMRVCVCVYSSTHTYAYTHIYLRCVIQLNCERNFQENSLWIYEMYTCM